MHRLSSVVLTYLKSSGILPVAFSPVLEYISMNQNAPTMVMVYGTAVCPHCVRVKNLLKSLKIPFEEKRVDENPALRAEMETRANGRRSVPQIFIGNKHIGGADDLFALHQNGNLRLLVKM